MAGLIKRADIDEVRNRVRIDDVVGEYVTLRSAGVDSLKGLCPFHDERTPSFHVRPSMGIYHCFGCGESGDMFAFLQKIDGLTFVESVERLADRAGIQLSYEDGGPGRRESASTRQTLLEMHQVASDFYRSHLGSPEAQLARDYMLKRGFDSEVLATFGVGYSPTGWDGLLKHLRSRGFSSEDILKAGLAIEGKRGLYDRFRGRLMWPIRDVTSRVIGFGARRLHEQDQGPKYLNTPETPLYHKNQVLYGLDLAKKSISKTKRAVVVEGYTDVMAAHLAGVTQAVASCGTAFGTEHIKILRRIMGDDAVGRGEVIFTFDGDEAGQKAALKAFEDEQKFVAQTYVAVEPEGLDPADLRAQHGDAAVRDLIEKRRPLFEFALAQALSGFDLTTVEGQVNAVRSAAPIVAGIRDSSLRPGYERYVAGQAGTDLDLVHREVVAAGRKLKRHTEPTTPPGVEGTPAHHQRHAPVDPHPGAHRHSPVPATQTPGYGYRVERGALQVALQLPQHLKAKLFDALSSKVFDDPVHRAVFEAMQAAGGVAEGAREPARWPEKVRQATLDPHIAATVTELSVAALPASDEESSKRYAIGISAGLFEKDLVRIAGMLHSRLQRTSVDDAETRQKLLQQLTVIEHRRAVLRQLK